MALVRIYRRLTFELEPGQVPLNIAYGMTATAKDGIWVKPRRRLGK